jgi:hypothetical protein
MDVAWVNVQYDKNSEKQYNSISDNSIERISIGSETIKIYYSQESERKETYVKIILINNIAGYEYPIVRGRGI